MTARQLPPPPVKECADPDCGATFSRDRGQSEHSWRRTRYCAPCATSRSRGNRLDAHRATRRDSGPAAPSFDHPDVARDWRTRAVCRGVDPELFYALSNDWRGRLDEGQAKKAKAVCARCPVRQPCLEAAAAERDMFAIRGGLTPAERQRLALGRSA